MSHEVNLNSLFVVDPQNIINICSVILEMQIQCVMMYICDLSHFY